MVEVEVEVEVEEKSGDDGGEPEAGGDHNQLAGEGLS
jgi:hypothetical protein